MNATTDKIAVLKTQLPYIDRRALSQAWFSAFHMATAAAGGAGVPVHAAPAKAVPPTPAHALAARREGAAPKANSAAVSLAHTRRAGDVSPVEGSENVASRRARPAAKPVGTALAEAAATVQATFTLNVDDARVAINVRHEHGKLRVIALCSARHIDIVQRALAKTALAMRARGAAIDTLVQASDPQERT